jgi:PIN domain nuclease of toxin-antitoxin system
VSYLLDTHVWLWLQTARARVRPEVLDTLQSGETAVFLSAVSSWEIAIKWAVGRLPLPEGPGTYIPSRMERSGVRGLAIEHAHALRVAELPKHHADPFDRLLIAQAQVEGLTIVTADPAFDAYDIPVAHATRP